MLTLRPASERGRSNLGWLDSRHTFSFSNYHDPAHMGFRTLRVINEDKVALGGGFGTHPHRDMEIISYVLEGTMAHRDSMGHTELLQAGELQRMSAGTGLTHSEFNGSDSDPLHFYQIWLLPDRSGHTPDYEQRSFPAEGRRNQWQLVIRPRGEENPEGALVVHQQARAFLADIEPGRTLTYQPAAGRGLWLQVVRGEVSLNGQPLRSSDAAAAQDEAELTLAVAEGASEAAHVLMFDLE